MAFAGFEADALLGPKGGAGQALHLDSKRAFWRTEDDTMVCLIYSSIKNEYWPLVRVTPRTSEYWS